MGSSINDHHRYCGCQYGNYYSFVFMESQRSAPGLSSLRSHDKRSITRNKRRNERFPWPSMCYRREKERGVKWIGRKPLLLLECWERLLFGCLLNWIVPCDLKINE